jgi:predicted ATPase/DNA-binding SARP family transcriptional activator/Tfp pilus assembly protein PilF
MGMSQPEQPASLKLTLLGPPQLEQDGAPVPIATRKAVALLAFLAVTGQAHSREALATLLWPEYEQARAFANLRRSLWVLNRAIGKEWLDVDAETAALRRTPGFWLDVDAFRHLLTESQTHDPAEAEPCPAWVPPLTEAVDLYRDDFMAGFTLPDSPGFDEWQFFEREDLRSELASALQRLVRCYTAQQEFEAAITYARRWLALDPLQEPAHRGLMRLYAWDGQRAAALRQYTECLRILDEELGVPPEEETTRLYEAIQAKQLPPPSEVPGEVPVSPTPRHNLPPQPTPFVGRETELAEIARLLRNPDCRLLTLVGPGGVGKSRLALEAAAGQRDLAPFPYPHGVYWVPLAAVSSVEFIVPTLAAALGFSFYPREGESPKQQLLNYLCDKQMLLLLDNFEQLVDSAHLLSEILERAPALRLLVTSRERLKLQPEWVFDVAGMRYPREEPVESLEAYSAVQLFLRRASQVDPGFAVPQEEIPDLIRICQLVEGMPLGIELAAAWVKLLSCREIANEIERCLDFLTTAMRDVPDRHRSLWAACDHSWALLSEEEQRAFQRLSVFRGGFEREAAERVAGASLPLLSSLVDKSLVRRERSARYEVHEVLRQYATEKLGQVPREEGETRDRHSAYFMAFLQHKETALKGVGQIKAMEEIGADLQNVRSAWRWSIAQGKVVEIRRAAPGLWLFYEMRSLLEEGEQAFAQAVAMLESQAAQGGETGVTLALALAFQGRFAGRLYRYEHAAQLLRRSQALLHRLGAQRELALANTLSFYPGAEESFPDIEQVLEETLAIYRGLGDRWGIAFALTRFLWLVGLTSTRSRDTSGLQESLAIGREIGDQSIVGLCLFQLGAILQSSGDFQESKQRYLESLAVFRDLGDRRLVQMCLDHTGYVARALGEYEEARQVHLESLTICREEGDRLGIAGSLNNLGLVARDMGDYAEAERYFQEGLAIRTEIGHRWSITVSLEQLGDVALAQGNYEEARRWYQESLEVSRGTERAAQMSEALRGLGEVSSAQGDFEQARQHFRDALELEMAGPVVYIPTILKVLFAVAQLAARTGDREKSAEWLATVAGHAASSARTRDRANRLLDELASQLPPQAMAAARERSEGKSLDDMVGEVLREL